MRRFLILIFLALFIQATSSAQSSYNSSSKNPEKGLFGKTGRSSGKVKSKKPVSVLKAKKNQEKNEKKLKKAYAKSIEASRKRAYDIQSPEVQTRMKQNQRDTTLKNKEKKKKSREGMKKAGKKYK